MTIQSNNIPNRRHVLLDRRLGEAVGQLLNVRRNMQRLDIDDLMEPLRRTPIGKLTHRMQVRPPRIDVPNVRREVLDEPLRCREIGRIQRRHLRTRRGRVALAERAVHDKVPTGADLQAQLESGRARTAAGVMIVVVRNGARSKRSLSPVTSSVATPSTASSRNLLSLGSRHARIVVVTGTHSATRAKSRKNS